MILNEKSKWYGFFYLILDFSIETHLRETLLGQHEVSWLTGRHSLYRAEETSFIMLLEVFVQLTIKLTAPLSCNLLGLFTGHSPTNNATASLKSWSWGSKSMSHDLCWELLVDVTASVFAFTQLPSWFHHSKLILLITSLNVLPLVFLQGGRLYIFWNGNRQAIFPWLNSRRSTSFNIQGEYEMNLIIAGDKRSPQSWSPGCCYACVACI